MTPTRTLAAEIADESLPGHALIARTFGEPRFHTEGDIAAVAFAADGTIWSVDEAGLLRHWSAEGHALKIVELSREDLPSVQRLLAHLRGVDARFILFCDDLSFSHDDQHYKSLKAVLDGGIEGRPDNVLIYATSNRRHLMPREMIENERSTAISPAEAVEEKVSLSDRFGLWLGFHPCSQDEYLAMIAGYAQAHGMDIPSAQLRADAIEWQATRGARSGRVAWQFFCDLAARQGVRL